MRLKDPTEEEAQAKENAPAKEAKDEAPAKEEAPASKGLAQAMDLTGPS